MSTTSSVEVDVQDDVAILRLKKGRANSLDPQLVEDLLDALRLTEVAEARALVLTGDGRHFSAGLDLRTLQSFGEARLLAFLDRLQGLLATVFVWTRPVVAAVDGHAIAGGCLLSLCADWRVASETDLKVGLNEIELGLPLPQAGLEIARFQLGARSWAEVIYGGELHGPAEAQRLGLLDELCPPGELLERAVARARMWGERSPVAFHRMKAALRDRVLLQIRENHEQQQQEWVHLWFSRDAQARLQAACKRLESK